MLKINGVSQPAQGQTITQYLAQEGYDVKTIVVEYNETILSKEQYDQTVLADGDVVEIVCFMGGG
jgi:sulfur carrier protein